MVRKVPKSGVAAPSITIEAVSSTAGMSTIPHLSVFGLLSKCAPFFAYTEVGGILVLEAFYGIPDHEINVTCTYSFDSPFCV